MGRKGLNRTLVLTITFALAFAAVMAFPSAHAQLTKTVQENYFWQFLPIIVGLGIGVVYFAAISARRSR